MRVDIVGMGPGGRDCVTLGAAAVASEAQVLIGAARLLDVWADCPGRKLALVSPSAVADALAAEHSCGTERACVLVSGDVGLFSLAAGLRKPLMADGRFEVFEHAGVSSLQYLCAAAHTPWQDVLVLSAHGRTCDVAGYAQGSPKVFALTGGSVRAHDVCRDLVERGLGHVRVTVGENLSLPDERIVSGDAAALARESFCDLACMLVENPDPVTRPASAPALRDDDFERDATPMTKEEVRELAVCKLRLEPDHTVWDVGAGTGSVSVECGLAVPRGRVFAVERDPERAGLVRRNAERLGATNVRVVVGHAPEVLADLPSPDRVFVGGSSGNLDQILEAALAANPRVRIVVAAIALETLSQAVSALDRLGLDDPEIVQVGAAKARKVAGLNLMQANNPVFLISGQGRGEVAPC